MAWCGVALAIGVEHLACLKHGVDPLDGDVEEIVGGLVHGCENSPVANEHGHGDGEKDVAWVGVEDFGKLTAESPLVEILRKARQGKARRTGGAFWIEGSVGCEVG